MWPPLKPKLPASWKIAGFKQHPVAIRRTTLHSSVPFYSSCCIKQQCPVQHHPLIKYRMAHCAALSSPCALLAHPSVLPYRPCTRPYSKNALLRPMTCVSCHVLCALFYPVPRALDALCIDEVPTTIQSLLHHIRCSSPDKN
eukprot:1150170-Pelagomonas_calceolata.AAC.8